MIRLFNQKFLLTIYFFDDIILSVLDNYFDNFPKIFYQKLMLSAIKTKIFLLQL